MVFPRMRAAVFGILFVFWLGFLTYLASRTVGRTIVSRPQVARSNLVVVAKLTNEDGRAESRVEVERVLFADDPILRQLAGLTIDIDDLVFISPRDGWTGSGSYVLPLTATGGNTFAITALPISPGYYPSTYDVTLEVGKNPDLLAERISAYTGLPRRRIRERLDAPTVSLRNVAPRDEAANDGFFDKVREANVRIVANGPAEIRIYPATADVVNQTESILRDRGE